MISEYAYARRNVEFSISGIDCASVCFRDFDERQIVQVKNLDIAKRACFSVSCDATCVFVAQFSVQMWLIPDEPLK